MGGKILVYSSSAVCTRKMTVLSKQTALNDTFFFVPQLEALRQKYCYLVLPRGR